MAYVGKITGTNGTTGLVGSTLYGTCATAAATVEKVVTLADFDTLMTGVTIHVKFTNNNTSTNPTLNVNSTGAKRIYRYGTTSPSTSSAWSWYAGAVVSFTYDGSAWIMNDMIGNDNTYDRTSIQMRIYAGANGVFPYSIVALDKNQRMQAMTTTGGTDTTKAFNSSEKFLYPPYIYYHSENSTKANGAVITNNVLYESFPNVNMTYSCNITTSAGFTQYKPIYIECTFDSDGYWSPTGITQTFTTGKYYILLGVTYSTSIYQMALTANHPVFYYDGTNLIDADKKYAEDIATDIASGYLPLTGGTMTGQIKTSFKSSVAVGSYQATSTTIPNLCEELRYSSGCMGSANITTAYTKDGVTVATMWYNFLWIPHRSGGVNGAASGDNCNYGTLILSGMTGGGAYLIRYGSAAIAELRNLYKDTLNTAGSTDTSSKIFLIGATSQAQNPQTYSDNEVYTTSGALTTKTVSVGGGSCTMQYNTTTQSLDFVFA